MKMNIKKLVVGTSIVGVMAMASGCASMGACGGSKCGSSDKKASSKCGADKKADTKCGSDKKADTKCGSK